MRATLAVLAVLAASAAAAGSTCSTTTGEIIGMNSIAESQVASIAECCDACNNNGGCLAFTFDTSGSGDCYLKDNTMNMGPNPDRVSGLRSAPIPPPPQPPTPVPIPRACVAPFNTFPFCNTSLPMDTRIRDLISRLEDEEKPPLLTARESPAGNVPRIGLPEYDWGANCVHGVQSRCGYLKNGTVLNCPTSFPCPNALGATFNMSLVQAMGQVIGVELRSLWLQGVGEDHSNNLPHLGLDCWSPNINVNRDPRWGRNQEVASEDPMILGEYGKAYTTGLQVGEDPRYLQAVVTLKHFDAYSLEAYGLYTRHDFDANVTAYHYADTYLPAFKAAVTEANAKGVMCSYNAVNGVPACANAFLAHMLRSVWNFTGYVTSDSGAIQDIYDQHFYVKTAEEAAAVAITDGQTDINSGSVYLSSLLNAVNESLCNMSAVDQALYNSLKMRFELGLFDPIEDQPYWHVPPEAVNTPASQALNLFATQQSLVLLKNDGVLPLPRGKRIAVIGPHGNAQQALVGNYIGQICPSNAFDCVVSPWTAITAENAKGGPGANTTYVQGCDVDSNDTSGFAAAVAAAKEADFVVLVMGIDQTVEREGYDRVSIDLPGVQHNLTAAIAAVGKPTVMFLVHGGMVAIEPEVQYIGAIVDTFYPGFQGSPAMASVLFGDYNPGGKLPITIYPADYVNQVSMYSMDMTIAPGRSYKYYTGTPTYPFGWGLSYTTFSLRFAGGSGAPIAFPTNAATASATLTVQVANTGAVAGDEVVFAYFRPQNVTTKVGGAVRILKQLFGFQRVNVAPGASTTVSFTVSPTTVKIADFATGAIVIAPGTYTLEFTNGVSQVATTTLTLTGSENTVDTTVSTAYVAFKGRGGAPAN